MKKILRLISPLFSRMHFTLFRLKKMPRFRNGRVTLTGIQFEYADAVSFAWQFEEIFLRGHYKFPAEPSPYIIDCGANVGVSVLYFAKNYPNANILAFEPDPAIFAVLKRNVDQVYNTRIQLVNKGLWNTEGEIGFTSDGADGGKVSASASHEKVRVTRLQPYLTRRVAMLKLDIEGAEYTVLSDCRDSLRFVDRIAMEYHSSIGSPQKLTDILHILRDAGFRTYLETVTIHNYTPFLERSQLNGYDNLINIYAWR